MKKLKLDLHNIEGSQVLTREQLKKVLGGVANVTTAGNCSISQACHSGLTISCSGSGSACKSVTCASGTVGIQCDSDDPICCSRDEA
ncbi:hypothetical protein [Chitinophaga niabensis]|uniref:Uncharacterized protein n=1 Tax=Chitinophaga niabensis TaxID=536979 RepID=A0A1N6DU52_9BACT|nr:hypothetical protein [Chitinophaga niabensis]SIN74237.1 hypothetical protein SAMN04488055_1077 [Chitinophaga niabensis]